MSHFYDLDPSDLDEFLVEYVDGTMDPVVREAFEEFLSMYPEVQAQVDCLSSVRTELCKLGADCRCQAPPGFQERLKRQLAGEMTGSVTIEHWAPQLNMIALAVSVAIFALAVGITSMGIDGSIADSEPAPTQETLVAEAAAEAAGEELVAGIGADDTSVQRAILANWAHSGTSLAHQKSSPGTFSAEFDRPVLLSVRRDLVAMRPMAMSAVTP
jgi:hypothetical protein